MADHVSLKSYGRYAWNPQVAMLLDRIAKKPLGMNPNNASPEIGAMLQGADMGVSPDINAEYIPYQSILEANPTLPIESALKLSSTPYLYTDNATANKVPQTYLQGHERSHLLDKLSQLKMSEAVPSKGVGNKGYLPVKRTRGEDLTTPAGIENMLIENYSPDVRDEERKAHLRGLEAYNLLRSR